MNRLIYQLSYQFTGSERYRVEEETHKHWYPHVARGIPSAPLTWPEEFNHVGRLQPRKTTHYHKRKSTFSRDEDAAQQKSEFTHTLPCSIRTTSKQRFDCQKHNLNNNTHKTCAKSPSPSPSSAAFGGQRRCLRTHYRTDLPEESVNQLPKRRCDTDPRLFACPLTPAEPRLQLPW